MLSPQSSNRSHRGDRDYGHTRDRDHFLDGVGDLPSSELLIKKQPKSILSHPSSRVGSVPASGAHTPNINRVCFDNPAPDAELKPGEYRYSTRPSFITEEGSNTGEIDMSFLENLEKKLQNELSQGMGLKNGVREAADSGHKRDELLSKKDELLKMMEKIDRQLDNVTVTQPADGPVRTEGPVRSRFESNNSQPSRFDSQHSNATIQPDVEHPNDYAIGVIAASDCSPRPDYNRDPRGFGFEDGVPKSRFSICSSVASALPGMGEKQPTLLMTDEVLDMLDCIEDPVNLPSIVPKAPDMEGPDDVPFTRHSAPKPTKRLEETDFDGSPTNKDGRLGSKSNIDLDFAAKLTQSLEEADEPPHHDVIKRVMAPKPTLVLEPHMLPSDLTCDIFPEELSYTSARRSLTSKLENLILDPTLAAGLAGGGAKEADPPVPTHGRYAFRTSVCDKHVLNTRTIELGAELALLDDTPPPEPEDDDDNIEMPTGPRAPAPTTQLCEDMIADLDDDDVQGGTEATKACADPNVEQIADNSNEFTSELYTALNNKMNPKQAGDRIDHTRLYGALVAEEDRSPTAPMPTQLVNLELLDQLHDAEEADKTVLADPLPAPMVSNSTMALSRSFTTEVESMLSNNDDRQPRAPQPTKLLGADIIDQLADDDDDIPDASGDPAASGVNGRSSLNEHSVCADALRGALYAEASAMSSMPNAPASTTVLCADLLNTLNDEDENMPTSTGGGVSAFELQTAILSSNAALAEAASAQPASGEAAAEPKEEASETAPRKRDRVDGSAPIQPSANGVAGDVARIILPMSDGELKVQNARLQAEVRALRTEVSRRRQELGSMGLGTVRQAAA